MPRYIISETESIYYTHHLVSIPGLSTFVFFNPLTGDTSGWEAHIAPNLREMGFGTLCFDYRGQTKSPFEPNTPLTSAGIVADAVSLLKVIQPENPILVGLSIGGLYAAQAWLTGVPANKLILINTLRKDGPRLKWIGDALVRAVEIGGLALFRDMFMPLLMNDAWLEKNRHQFLGPSAGYSPLTADSGTFRLLAEAGPSADWDLPYERLTLPTLVVTGLQDHVFLENEVVNQLFSRLPCATRVDIAEAGHLIPAEHPDKLVKIIQRAAISKENL